jgi:neutral ceramidase
MNRPFLLFLLSFALSVSALGEELRGAVFSVDITPQAPVMLGGYASRTNLSQGVHDRLYARAFAIALGDRRLLLISLDNLGFYNATAEPLRRAILEASGLRPSELFLCAIHTHSAPILTLDAAKGHSNNVAYTQNLQGKLAALARDVLGRLRPAELGLGTGASPVGANRRESTVDTNGTRKVVLGRNPGVLTDREVQVLKMARPDNQELTGVLFAYATHSTSLGARNYQVSGDIHGLAARFVEEYLGTVAPEFAGASGNIDPWYRVLPAFKSERGWIPEPVLLGTLLGEEVIHVLNNIQKPLPVSEIKSAIKTVSLPGKTQGQLSQMITNTTASMVLTVASLGNVAFVGMGGEVFTEIGQRIKKESPFAYTFIFTHCNGAAGYLPTAASYPEGGYEVQSSPFAPGADDAIARAALTMLKELRP